MPDVAIGCPACRERRRCLELDQDAIVEERRVGESEWHITRRRELLPRAAIIVRSPFGLFGCAGTTRAKRPEGPRPKLEEVDEVAARPNVAGVPGQAVSGPPRGRSTGRVLDTLAVLAADRGEAGARRDQLVHVLARERGPHRSRPRRRGQRRWRPVPRWCRQARPK